MNPKNIDNNNFAFNGKLITRDIEPLPRKLRDVKKERVILIEKTSNMGICDNLGTGYIDL